MDDTRTAAAILAVEAARQQLALSPPASATKRHDSSAEILKIYEYFLRKISAGKPASK